MSELEPASPPTERTAARDRRRAGRPEHVAPTLIPLLRGESAPPAAEAIQFGDPDQLRGVRGLAVGVALSAPLWAAAGLMGRWLFR